MSFFQFSDLPSELQIQIVESLAEEYDYPLVAQGCAREDFDSSSSEDDDSDYAAEDMEVDSRNLENYHTNDDPLTNESPSHPSRQVGRPTLAALCHVSRHLRSIAEPVLYRRFSFHHRWVWTPRGLKSLYNFASFVITLQERPELASYIRELTIEESFCAGFADKTDSAYYRGLQYPPLPEEMRGRLKELAKGFCDRVAAEVLTNIDEGTGLFSFSMLVQLLLTTATSLQKLELRTMALCRGGRDCFGNFLQDMQERGTPFVLPRLQQLRISHIHPPPSQRNSLDYLPTTFQLAEARLLLASPDLREVEFDICTGLTRDYISMPSFAHLKHVAVKGSRLTAADMNTLSAVCKGLVSFTYCSAGRGESELDYWITDGLQRMERFEGFPMLPEATPRDMQEALSRHADTLQHIEVKYGFVPDDLDQRDRTMTSLKAFTSLQTLIIKEEGFIRPTNDQKDDHPGDFNLGGRLAYLLPDQLSTLEVCGVSAGDIKGLAAEIKTGRFRNLESIVFGSWCDRRESRDLTDLSNGIDKVRLAVERLREVTRMWEEAAAASWQPRRLGPTALTP